MCESLINLKINPAPKLQPRGRRGVAARQSFMHLKTQQKDPFLYHTEDILVKEDLSTFDLAHNENRFGIFFF